MKFLSDILAKAGLTVDGVVTLNNTATGQTPAANDNSTKLATTAWVRTFVQPYSLPIASASILGGIKVGTGLSIDSGTGILSVTGGSASSLKSTQTFVVTEGQTVFTVTNSYAPGLIDIFLNGVYLSPNQSTATNGSTFTLNDPAATGDIIDVIVVSPVYQGTSTTTDQLPEGVVNLYYTNARARAAITLTVNGSSGASTYSSSTGVLNVPTYTLAGLGGIGGSGTTGYVSKFTNSTTIGNSLIYDDGFGIGINTSSPYNTSFYSLDVNGALLVKNVGKAANITLINADPAGGGNNAFVIHTVGGTLTNSYVDIQGYYGASVTGSTTIRLNAAGGNLLVGSLIGTGTRMVVASSTGILSTQDIVTYVSQVKHQVKSAQVITKGQAVYVSSADGTNMIVSKASNATEGTSSKTMGLLDASVSINGFANVVTEGLLAGLNTASANAGDPVWLGTDGNLIYGLLNKPSAPAHLVFIGIVTRANANNGEIFVKVQNGFELDELHDLSVKNPSDGDMIKYVASTGLWTKIAASTTNIVEGTNLYYTDARVGTYLTNNSYATQSYVNTAVSNLVDAAPGTLDTLNELAAALGDDPNFATTVATSIGTKEPIITAGTTSQYWRGDKTWQTLPIYTLSGLGGQPQLNGTGFVKVSGTTVSYDNSTYYLASNPNGYITGISFANVSAKPTTIAGYGITDSLVYTTSTYSNPSWITALAWSKITGAPAFITSYTETDTLATVTGRGASTSTAVTFNASVTFAADKYRNPNSEYAIDLRNSDIIGANAIYFDDNAESSGEGINFWRSAGYWDTLRSEGGVLYYAPNRATASASTGFTVYHSGNLTNLNQLTNGPGYITGYTETDTLATVSSRGASTTTALTINADEGLKVIYNGTGGDVWIRGWGIESNRGAVYLRPTTNNTQTLLIGYNDGNQNWGTVLVGSGTFTWNGETVATRTWVTNQSYVTSSNWAVLGSPVSYNVDRTTKVSNGLAIYSAYLGGANSPHTYDISAQFIISGRGMEFSGSWHSPSATLAFRTLRDCCDNWSAWVTMLSSANYNSYSPTLTGGNASGTWGINVTGTAGSETLATVTGRGSSTSTNLTFSGQLSLNKSGTQLKISRLDSAAADWFFHSWASGLNIYPNAVGTVYFGRDGSATNVDVYNGTLYQQGNAVLHTANYSSYALPLSGGNITGRVEFQYSSDKYSQAWRNNTTGAYWWVTTESDKLGFHRNGDGDKFYFSNGGDFWSSGNGWLSTALAGKSNTGHDHNGVYVPINPDGDGAAWSYVDENPTINGVYLGGGQRFGADGDLNGGFLQARVINATNSGIINSAGGYYVGSLDFGSIGSATVNTTQVITSTGAIYARANLYVTGSGLDSPRFYMNGPSNSMIEMGDRTSSNTEVGYIKLRSGSTVTHDFTANTDVNYINSGSRFAIGSTTANGWLQVSGSHIGGYGIANFVSTDNAIIALESTGSYDIRLRYKYQGADKWFAGMSNSDVYRINNASDSSAITITQACNVSVPNGGLDANNYLVAGTFIRHSSGGSAVTTEYSGTLVTADNYPACNENARIYTIGTLNGGGGGNSFIEVEVFGSHRGYTPAGYVEYKKWIIYVGDRISSNFVASAGSDNNIGLWNGSNSNGLLGVYGDHVANGWVLRIIVNPSCGAGKSYTCKVKYSNLNMTHGPFTYSTHSSYSVSNPRSPHHTQWVEAGRHDSVVHDGSLIVPSGYAQIVARSSDTSGLIVQHPSNDYTIRSRASNGRDWAWYHSGDNFIFREPGVRTYMTFQHSSGKITMGDTDSQWDCQLRIHGDSGSSGYTTSDMNNILHLSRNSHAYIIFSSPNGYDQGMHFVNTSANAIVGRIAYQHSGSGLLSFSVNSDIRLQLNASGTLTASGDVVAYGSPSDARLKTIKEKVPNALDKILKLNGYRFDWNKVDSLTNIKEDVGVIAQEVEAVIPELARTNDDGQMSVRYQGLTAVLIEAIKEQQAQIESQKSEIEELKDLVKQLINR